MMFPVAECNTFTLEAIMSSTETAAVVVETEGKRTRGQAAKVFASREDAESYANGENSKRTRNEDTGKLPPGVKVYAVAAARDVSAGESCFVVTRSPASAVAAGALEFGVACEREDSVEVPDPETYLSMLDDEQVNNLAKLIRERKRAA